MRINHNISALNAYNHQQRNVAQTSRVMEKLVSGMRINRAADDAAGLNISEKMRAQTRGLSQADRNILDGVFTCPGGGWWAGCDSQRFAAYERIVCPGCQ